MDKDATSASSTRLSAVDQSGKADASSQGLKRITSPSPAPSTGSAARRKKLRPPAPKRAGMTPPQATAPGAPGNAAQAAADEGHGHAPLVGLRQPRIDALLRLGHGAQRCAQRQHDQR